MEGSGGWSEWQALRGAHRDKGISTQSGLYRVRRPDRSALLYLGQSGRLKSRLGDLQAVFREEIPFNDPHTAAPCLWVLRVHQDAELEVSVRDAPVDVAQRKALECVEVALHRRDHGVSPYANFGRMPPGWVKSSQNNAKLRARGLRRRGYADSSATRTPGHPCMLDQERTPDASGWGGLEWSSWNWGPPPVDAVGVYRIRRPGGAGLLYIGQGRLRSRLSGTIRAVTGEAALGAQGLPKGAGHSWVEMPDVSSQELLECENDLIASHVLATGAPPEWQFRRY